MFWYRSDVPQGYVPPRMADGQMEALEEFISLSPDASDFAKKVVIWLLRQTDNLTRAVALSLGEDGPFESGMVMDMQKDVHDMVSTNGSTHVRDYTRLLGTKMSLCHVCGVFVDGKLNPRVGGSTIWVSFVLFDPEAEVLQPPTPEDIAAIELRT